MIPTFLSSTRPARERWRYWIVRVDRMEVVEPGVLIMWADADIGRCSFHREDGNHQHYDFGPKGLRIVVAQ